MTTSDKIPSCSWKITDSGLLTVSVSSAQVHGIADEYTKATIGQYQLFEKITIDGYPAAHSDAFDGRSAGNCQTFVGVNNTQIIIVGVFGWLPNPCAMTDAVAKTVLSNIKSGA
jgi:hypothetical protein